jgi:hypothetical protein
VRQTARIVGDANWAFVLGPSRAAFVHDAGVAWTLGRAAGAAAIVLLSLGLVTSTVVAVRGARLRRGWPPLDLQPTAARRALLLVWLVGIWLSYADSATDRVQPHYLIVAYPVSFAFVVLGLADASSLLRGPARRIAAGASVALVIGLAAAFFAFTFQFHRFLARHGGTGGDYGVIYRDSSALAGLVRARGLDSDDPAVEFLATGSDEPPKGARRLVTTLNLLANPHLPPCRGERRSFGPLTACFPP